MTPRELRAWIATVSTLVIWSYYFATFWVEAIAGQLDGWELLWRFVWCMVAVVVIGIVLNVLGTIAKRQSLDAPPYEMERQIDGRADRIGFRVLEILVPCVLIPGLMAPATIAAAYPADPAGATAIILANAVLLAVVVTELVREITCIISYRMIA